MRGRLSVQDEGRKKWGTNGSLEGPSNTVYLRAVFWFVTVETKTLPRTQDVIPRFESFLSSPRNA